jgi:hypothetical protein
VPALILPFLPKDSPIPVRQFGALSRLDEASLDLLSTSSSDGTLVEWTEAMDTHSGQSLLLFYHAGECDILLQSLISSSKLASDKSQSFLVLAI